ncbi:MAG: four helix bundle suffix domain-containing protein [Kiritimatiellae bacterium]|nr:four helix bundle suffix domain-containing protein [Kiritimatiellia bacterium]
MSAPILAPSGGYRKMLSFGFVCLAYHATCTFCERNFTYQNDPLGKTSGQMIGAARSARQNLVEASSRAGTSTETELRLLDVAKASLEELAGDFEAFLLHRRTPPWGGDEPRAKAFRTLSFDPFTPAPGEDARHAFGVHFLAMRERFATLLESEDPVVAANGILLCIDRAAALLRKQMEKTAATFTECGGFTERLSAARIEARDAQLDRVGDEVPRCPECDAPMVRRIARKGQNAGKPFFSCSQYPNCKGTRPC